MQDIAISIKLVTPCFALTETSRPSCDEGNFDSRSVKPKNRMIEIQQQRFYHFLV